MFRYFKSTHIFYLIILFLKTSVEISVNPENIAGVRTAEGAVSRWNGRILDNQIEVELSGSIVMHDCWLIPRLPLGVNR